MYEEQKIQLYVAGNSRQQLIYCNRSARVLYGCVGARSRHGSVSPQNFTQQ